MTETILWPLILPYPGLLSRIAGDGTKKRSNYIYSVTDVKFGRHEVCTFMRVFFPGFVISGFN